MGDKMAVLVAVAVLGISAQWIAWRLHLPSILVLLLFGILAGVSGVLDPNALLGDLFLPGVSLSVALILYEGGLTLRVRELGVVGGVVRNLVTVGALITWMGATLAALWLFDLTPLMSALVGSIFVVTGPTVVGPLLRQVRPTGSVGPILKWEGIVIDPIGAMLAVLIVEVVRAGQFHSIFLSALALLETLAAGTLVGSAGALLLYSVLKRHLVADHLQNPISLMLVLMVFASGNLMQHEAGLFGVTLMGVILANQRSAHLAHIIEFKENLRVLLISFLFILLAARLEIEHLQSLGWRHFLFLGILIVVVRPVQVFCSTLKSNLTFKEKLFLCAMAPRGIVAAAVASVLALELAAMGRPEGEIIVPLTFLVIIGTVAFYGIAAAPIARALGISGADRAGLVILGAHQWAREVATSLHALGCRVLLVDSNRREVMEAKLGGVPVHHGNLLAESALEELDLSGLGRLLALTPNDEVNALACHRLADVFGRSEVYQLAPAEEEGLETPGGMGGRRLFGDDVGYASIEMLRRHGAVFETVDVTPEFELDAYLHRFRGDALPLFLVNANGGVSIFAPGEKVSPSSGDRLVSLVVPENASVDVIEEPVAVS